LKKIKVVELFSGIGSQARALKNIGFKIDVRATCEWDINAIIAYDSIHNGTDVLPSVESMSREALIGKLSAYTLSSNGKEPIAKGGLGGYTTETLKRLYSSITRCKDLVDITNLKGAQMPDKIDLLTYSFPCQDLSNVGAFHGYNKGIDKNSGSRSSLLWQVGRILGEMKGLDKRLPKYLVMENVPTLLSKRHINNFKEWIGVLEKLGYISKYVAVNAKNYGIPQNRPRLLMMSVYVGGNALLKGEITSLFEKWGDNDSYIVNAYKKSKYFKNVEIKDLIRLSEDKNSKYWEEAIACTPNNTPSRLKIWRENPKIIDENGRFTKETAIRTITTKQDRNPNSGNIYFNSGIEGRGCFRYLTPRECLLFMGFTDKDYERLLENNPRQRKNGSLFTRDKIIRMAGNSIPVKMLEGFFFQLYSIEKIYGKYTKPKTKNKAILLTA